MAACAMQLVESRQQLRDRLILEHLPQVRLIARRIHDRLPKSVALDDLVSTGVVGLISAIDHYDSSHKVQLKTYAEYKIRGAILDSLRGLDFAPRLQRQKAKRIQAATAAAERKLNRPPIEEEVANELKIGVDEYRAWLVEVRAVNIRSFECAHAGQEDARDLLATIAADDGNSPSELFERAELSRVIASAVNALPPIERLVLRMYYHEERTLRDIAQVVRLHESRISQLKGQAIARLRQAVGNTWPRETRGEAHNRLAPVVSLRRTTSGRTAPAAEPLPVARSRANRPIPYPPSRSA